MRSLNIIISGLLIAAVGAFAVELEKWEYVSQINLTECRGEYAEFDVTPQVYNSAKSDLSDIRIIDSAGQQIPFLVISPGDVVRRQKYSPDIINRTINETQCSLLTLDFGRLVIKDTLVIETSGGNFRRAVMVEGSNDNVNFFILVKRAFVFAVDYREDSRFSTVEMPPNDYRYLRITVEPMTEEKNAPVIDAVRVYKSNDQPVKRTPVEIKLVKQSQESKEKISVYEYDLGYRNIPVSELNFQIDDDTFYRYITIEGRDAATKKVKLDSEDNRQRFREVEQNWMHITCGTVYKYTSTEQRQKTTISISPERARYRYLRIKVKNYDDKPLSIVQVKADMTADRVVFVCPEDLKASLYIGNNLADKPQYDLARQIENPAEVKAAAAALGSLDNNPIFSKAMPQLPWTERHKSLLIAIMAVMVLVLGWFIMKSFKSIGN